MKIRKRYYIPLLMASLLNLLVILHWTSVCIILLAYNELNGVNLMLLLYVLYVPINAVLIYIHANKIRRLYT
uniref:Uncharacterized protein n=1 Tax=viral metagenome TaxID=1070528 RepID=A0A6M3KWY3_9ZZZZ